MKIKFSGEIEIDPADLPQFIQAITPAPAIPQSSPRPEPSKAESPEPVTIPKPTEKPANVSVGVENITQKWIDTLLTDKDAELTLSEGLYRVDHISTIPIQNRKVRINAPTNRASIIFGKPNYNKWADPISQNGVLFGLRHGADFLSTNINFCQDRQIRAIEPWMPAIFSSEINPNIQWKAAVRNCDTTAQGRHGGFGLGTLYGSIKGNYIAAQNMVHAGNGFIEGKANIGNTENGILYLIMDNVLTDGENEEEFGSFRFKVKGVVKDNVFTITSDHDTSILFNHFFNTDHNDNYSHILHIGRYTYMIDDVMAVMDAKRIRLRPLANGEITIRINEGKIYTPGYESHAADRFFGLIMEEKWRDEHPTWSNNFNPSKSDIAYHPFLKAKHSMPDGYHRVEWFSSWDQEGIEQDAWLISKGNDAFRTYPETQFGKSHEILSGMVVGHNMYNHAQISIWARNVIQKGFYRQTNGAGRSLGVNMVDCSGFKDQFNPSLPVRSDRSFVMPDPIRSMLS